MALTTSHMVNGIGLLNFGEIGHPIFQAACLVERGLLKSKGGGLQNHSLERK